MLSKTVNNAPKFLNLIPIIFRFANVNYVKFQSVVNYESSRSQLIFIGLLTKIFSKIWLTDLFSPNFPKISGDLLAVGEVTFQQKQLWKIWGMDVFVNQIFEKLHSISALPTDPPVAYDISGNNQYRSCLNRFKRYPFASKFMFVFTTYRHPH